MRMNHNVYLPDELGQQAKDAELNLSRLLRDAVTDELERIEAVSMTLENPQKHEVWIEGNEGGYTGRITGTLLYWNDNNDDQIFLTDDERVLVYDGNRQKVEELEADRDGTLEERLRGWIADPSAYVDVLNQLGLEAVIDL
jgi:post-segregation antitoxin (ccd killing protein)